MNKVFMFLLLGMFMLSFGSAMEIDNVKEYNPITREVTFYNTFFGFKTSEVGKARLNTPLNVRVGAGYQKVAEFDIWAYEDYNDALKQFTFEDMKKGREKINRDYDLKYLTYEEVEVNDYGTIQNGVTENGTAIYKTEIIGTHTETREKWIKVTPANLKKNERLTIGIFTEVQIGDYVDWVPTIYGVEVPEWATWTANLNVDLVNYYKLDELSGTIAIDSINNNNGTNVGTAIIGVTGKVGTAYDFDGVGDYIELPSGTMTYGDKSVSMWITNINNPDWNALFTTGGTSGWGLNYDEDNNFLRIYPSAEDYNINLETGGWFHIVLTQLGTTAKLYVNGFLVNTVTNPDNVGTLQLIGAYNSGGGPILNHKGKIDEFVIWNRTITQTEVTQLWNNSYGITWTDSFNDSFNPPSITLTSPTTANHTTIQAININFTASDDINLDSVKLYVNGVLNQTNASGINNSVYSFPLILGDGEYTIYGKATDNESQETNSGSIIIGIDTTPFIELVTPPTLANNLNITQEYIPIKVSVSTPYFQNITYSLRNINGTEYTQFYTSETYDINFTDSPDGFYNYDVTICTTTNQCNVTETRNVNHDATPPIVTISNPTGTINTIIVGDNITLDYNITPQFTGVLDSCWYAYGVNDNLSTTDGIYVSGIGNNPIILGYIEVIDNSTQVFIHSDNGAAEVSSIVKIYDGLTISGTPQTIQVLGSNETETAITVSNGLHLITYTGGIFGGSTAKLDKFTIDNTTLITPIEDLNCSENTSEFEYITGFNNLTVFATDTFGNIASNFTSWNYKVTQNSLTYEEETISGDQENFALNLTMGTGYEVSSAIFVYNGEEYSTEIFTNGETIISVTGFSVPIYTVDTNTTFYFKITLSDSTQFNTTNYNQLALAIFLDDCSSFTNQLFNISLYDEVTKSPLSGDIEILYNILSIPNYNNIGQLNFSFTSETNVALCSSFNLTDSNFAQSVEIRYSSTGYSPELYHIQRGAISEEAVAISLFDLNASSATIFKVTYQDSTFNFVEGAVLQLQRKYISEGIYEVVEAPLTSNEGIAVLHVDLDSVKYRATIIKDGIVLDTFDNIVFKCQSELTGECEQKLLGSIDPQNNIDFDITRDFSYGISRSDNVVTVSFTIPSGLPSSTNIVLVQNDQFGSSQMCNKTVVSSGGSVQCTFNDTLGDSYIDFKIYKDGVPIAANSYIIEETNGLDFLGNNYIIILVLLFSIVGMALTSPEWIIINAIIVMVISGALWLANGLNFVVGLGNLMWLIIAAGILIFKLAKQEDR